MSTPPQGGARICVREEGSDWPISLVIFQTVSNWIGVSDNEGILDIFQQELIDEPVYFHIHSPGYAMEKDEMGYSGQVLTLKRNQIHFVVMQRTSLARRIGRLTGVGLVRGMRAKETGIAGCDSIQTAHFRGNNFHVWGDTKLLSYPLGIFQGTVATSSPHSRISLPPLTHSPYTYFVDLETRCPKKAIEISGDRGGPTWLSGLVSLNDRNGTQHLGGVYSLVEPGGSLNPYEIGLCEWNTYSQQFEQMTVLWRSECGATAPPLPMGHAVPWTDKNQESWVLFGDPFPHLRMRAQWEHWRDPTAWIPVRPSPLLQDNQGRSVVPHRGSIVWSDHRQKWICIFTQEGGQSSHLGEIWFCESDMPFGGTWSSCVQVLSHKNYTFYNPRVVWEWSPPDADFLLFEGTYSNSFTRGSTVATPHYDYNQILYRLNFEDLPIK